MAGNAVAAVRNFISKIPFKAPWKWTGVASSNEFLSHQPLATDYRKHAPGSQPLKPMVPHSETERVYDIRYWIRDTRREGMLVGGTNKTHLVKYQYEVAGKDDSLMELETPPTPGKPYKWGKRKGLLDVENNGYT